MKYIKTFNRMFEDLNWSNDSDNVGRYIIMLSHPNDKLIEFVRNNPGQIVSISTNSVIDVYDVKYDNIPDDITKYFSKSESGYDDTSTFLSCIQMNFKFVCDTAEECLVLLQSNKFNL